MIFDPITNSVGVQMTSSEPGGVHKSLFLTTPKCQVCFTREVKILLPSQDLVSHSLHHKGPGRRGIVV